MDLQTTSRNNLLLLIVVAAAAFCVGQATSSRYELSRGENSAILMLLDKRTGTLYFSKAGDGKWNKAAAF